MECRPGCGACCIAPSISSLDKPAGDALPVSIEMQLPMEGSPLSVRVADVLRLRGRLPDGQRDFAAQVAFGSSMPSRMNTVPLSENDSTPHTLDDTMFVRATFGPMPVRSVNA